MRPIGVVLVVPGITALLYGVIGYKRDRAPPPAPEEVATSAKFTSRIDQIK